MDRSFVMSFETAIIIASAICAAGLVAISAALWVIARRLGHISWALWNIVPGGVVKLCKKTGKWPFEKDSLDNVQED